MEKVLFQAKFTCMYAQGIENARHVWIMIKKNNRPLKGLLDLTRRNHRSLAVVSRPNSDALGL